MTEAVFASEAIVSWFGLLAAIAEPLELRVYIYFCSVALSIAGTVDIV